MRGRAQLALPAAALGLVVWMTFIPGCGKPSVPDASNEAGVTDAEPTTTSPTARYAQGARPMTREELLEQMRPHTPDSVSEIAPSLVAAARAMPRALVEIALGADVKASLEARSLILNNVDELAIVPIIEAPTPPDVDERLVLALAAVDAELALRNKLIAHLERLLDDKSRVPFMPLGPPVEGERVPKSRRVCDDAYLLMRRLRHPELKDPEDEADPEGMHEGYFMRGDDGFKDQEITRARKSGNWTRRLTLKDWDGYVAKHMDPGPHSPRRSK